MISPKRSFIWTLEALGEYQFSEIEVVTHSMDNVEKYYSERKKYAAEKVQTVEIRLPVKLK